MKRYLNEFMTAQGYTEEEKATLLSALDTVSLHAGDLFPSLIKEYETDMACDLKAQLNTLTARAAEIGVHEYTLHLLLFLCHSRALRGYYEKHGLSLDIWSDSTLDLLYKNRECELVKGITGSFVAPWFVAFFQLRRFALGRLQFECRPFGHHFEKNGKVLTPESRSIAIHIPRSLAPFDTESRRDAYRRAIAFFGCDKWDTPVAFTCHSWLLYPPMVEVLSPKSNTYAFAKEFHIVENHPATGHPDLWRLFDMDEPKSLADYPTDTSLRRAIRDYVMAGGTTGESLGVFFADEADLL